MDPLASIIINNYNYESYIAEAIDSALNQSYSNIEVIVVDDGSTDQSRAVIEKYRGRARLVLKDNGGQASTFNTGFLASRGEIVCFLDSDDAFVESKVGKVVEAMSDNSRGWCFHSVQWTDSSLHPVPGTPEIGYTTGPWDFRDKTIKGTSTFRAPATSGLAFSRDLLQTLLPMPEELRITSDNYLKLASVALSPGYIIAEPLALQRIHGYNAYTTKKDDSLRANISVTTAISLRKNFPRLRPISNRLFAAGIADKWKSGSAFRQTCQEVNSYVADLPLAEKSETLARIISRVVRQSLRG